MLLCTIFKRKLKTGGAQYKITEHIVCVVVHEMYYNYLVLEKRPYIGLPILLFSSWGL